MKRLPLVLFAFLQLTNVSWASCPSGQEENERTGHCEPVQGARTFETLTEGYCYRYDERSNIYPQFVDLDYCDALGGVLFDRRDCALKDRYTNGAFCIKAKENENIKKVMAEYLRKKNAVYCYRATPELFYKPTTLRCESGDRRITHQEHLQGRVSDTSTSTASSSSSRRVWCANATSYWKTTKTSCINSGGTVHTSKWAAHHSGPNLEQGSSASTSTALSSDKQVTIKIGNGTYTGEVLNGMRHGQGTFIILPWGDKYIGEWRDDKKHGQGTFTFPNGDKYVGEWTRDKKHGHGMEIWANGSKYVGEFKDNKPWNGVQYSVSGGVTKTYSSGNWCDDCKPTKNQLALATSISEGLSSSSETSTASSSDSEKVWCATKYSVRRITKYSCNASRGKAHLSEHQAKAEHKRLKAASTSTASSSEEENIWCTTKWDVYPATKTSCDEWNGKAFSSKYQAKAQHKRLKGSSSSYSSTASSSKGIWCANARWVVYTDKHSCDKWKAKAFATKYQAQAEHKRLKAASTPAIKTASLTVRSNVKDDKVYVDNQFKGSTRLDLDLPKGKHTIRIEKGGYETYEETINLTDNLIIRGNLEKVAEEPVQTASVDKETVFWQSIQGSDDPDMFQAYIDQFPEGVYVSIAKIKIKKLGATEVAKSSIPDLDYGQYHALVIGNNDYAHLPKLKTAVNDADAVTSLLKNKYGFSVKLLKNAKRTDIVSALSAFRRTVSRDDNFLLYYAGHGYLDEAVNEGYWLPVDAERDDPSNWLQNDTIVTQLKGIQAKHVMVVADSCFSGTISRGLKMEQRTPDWLQRMVKKKSRTALTSGGVEPVSDSGGGSHSVFAKFFLSLLEENEEVIDATQLFSRLRRNVVDNSLQTPEYGNIHQAGHDGGDFLFVRQ